MIRPPCLMLLQLLVGENVFEYKFILMFSLPNQSSVKSEFSCSELSSSLNLSFRSRLWFIKSVLDSKNTIFSQLSFQEKIIFQVVKRPLFKKTSL